MNMKKMFYIIGAVLATASCAAFDDAEYADIAELAVKDPSVVIAREGGEVELQIYSNGKVSVTPLNEFSDWCEIENTSFSGDGKIKFTFTSNNGFRRMAKLLLSLDGGVKTDTLKVRQEGEETYLRCNAPFKNVSGTGDSYAEYVLLTNIPLESLSTLIRYVRGGQGWVKAVEPDMGNIVVSTSRSDSEHSSVACVNVSFVDGWDNKLSMDLYVTRSNAEGRFGEAVSFDRLREYAGRGVIEDDIYVEAVVVSDYRSMNMEENPSVNYDKVDVTENERTAYLQSPDGSKGVRIKFDDPQANVLAFNTKVELSLAGLTVVREENPERYTIWGVTGDKMVSSENGDFVVSKRRTISQLTPDDTYTFVELTGTEFANKVGSYTNVYENYTLRSPLNSMLSGNNDRFDSWATLLIDDEGCGIYAPVNMLCLWRRDGRGVPQGVGSTKGVIVHNEMNRYGDVGPYQIRVLDESGFCQEWEGSGSYKTICKWDGSPFQYKYSQWKAIDPQYGDPGTKASRVDSKIPSDDLSAGHPAAGVMTLENKSYTPQENYPIAGSFSYTGISVADGGCDRGIDPNRKAMKLTLEIKGWYEWTDNKISGYKGLCYDFSTKGLSGQFILFDYEFHVGTISAASSQYFPAHWCAEYSLDGGKTYTLCPDNVTGGDYTHLHTMPWYDATIAGVKYFSASHCGIGATQHAVVIPAEAFGRDSVRVRLRPYDNVMAVFPIEWNDDTETGRILHNTTVNTTVINIERVHIMYR